MYCVFSSFAGTQSSQFVCVCGSFCSYTSKPQSKPVCLSLSLPSHQYSTTTTTKLSWGLPTSWWAIFMHSDESMFGVPYVISVFCLFGVVVFGGWLLICCCCCCYLFVVVFVCVFVVLFCFCFLGGEGKLVHVYRICRSYNGPWFLRLLCICLSVARHILKCDGSIFTIIVFGAQVWNSCRNFFCQSRLCQCMVTPFLY